MIARFVSIDKGLGPEGRIALVRLDRSDAINALSPAVMRQLRAAAQTFEDDVATSVVILTGNARVFSAGFDPRMRKAGRAPSWDLESGARHSKWARACARRGGTWSR